MAAALWMLISGAARAELTVNDLTGAAVTGVGPYVQDVEDAIREFGARDFAGAFKHLESAKQSTPRLAPAEVMMAQLYFDAGQPAPGVTLLESVIRKVPGDPEALVILGERAVAEGRMTEADMLFDRAAKVLDKFNENAKRKQSLQGRMYSAWGVADESVANWADAQKKFEELLKVDPRNSSAHEKLGRVLFRLGDQRRAYAEFQTAADADKNAPIAELAMAALSTDPVKADNWLNVALKKGSSDLRTVLGATDYLLRNNRIDEAKTQADEAIKLDPKGLESNLFAGVIARMLGDYKKATTHLSTAHLLAPGNPVVMNHLALVLLESQDEGDHKRAVQYAELNARQNPNSPEIMAALGWVYYRLQRRADAQRAYTAVLNANFQGGGPNQAMSSEMGFYMAHLAVERGKIAEAIRILRDALNNNQPFAYRKPALEMLDKLVKYEKAQAAKGKGGSAKTSDDKSDKSERSGKADKSDKASTTK